MQQRNIHNCFPKRMILANFLQIQQPTILLKRSVKARWLKKQIDHQISVYQLLYRMLVYDSKYHEDIMLAFWSLMIQLERILFVIMWSILIDQNRMKLQIYLCSVLILIRLSINAQFCSPVCNTGCDGDESTECDSRCWSDGVWSVSSGGTCIPKASSNWAYYDKTSDLGGTLTLTGTTGTFSCGQDYFKSSTSNGPITVSTPIAGITKDYYQLKWYVGIISKDVKCNGCDGDPTWKWTQSTEYTVTFSDNTVTPTPIYKIDSSSVARQRRCGQSKYREYYFRASTLYTYNVMNTQLSWTIQNNQTTTGQWGIRQFIILIRSCHEACSQCFGPLATQCTACTQNTTIYWLSNNTCNETCLYRFGYGNPYTCIYCDLNCTSCYMDPLNCSTCTVSGLYASYLRADSATTTTCVNACQLKQFANKTSRTCDPCDNVCATCINRANYCTSCQFGFYWTGWYCYDPCPAQYFLEANNNNCSKCIPYCSVCVGAQDICTECTLTGQFKAFLLTDIGTGLSSCVRVCNQTYYGDTNNGTGPNICMPCNTTCLMCTGFPQPCTKCMAGYYLDKTYCTNTCPNGTFAYNTTATEGICLNCDIYCIGLTVNMYFPDITNSLLYIDMLFTGELDNSIFDKTTFQTISISSKSIQYTLDMFTVTYVDLSASSYRIILEPKTYIFLYNATFTVQTKAEPSPIDTALSGIPFKTSNYLKTASATWFLIKGPPFSGLQLSVMNAVSNLSTNINNAFGKPYFQQIKKTGIFNLLFSGAQITSCSMLSNQIQSQNLYEGVRMWAVFVFFDAPAYEQISNKTKRFVDPTIEDLIRDAQEINDSQGQQRRLFSTDTMYWRFQRTGQTSFFIYDVYIPLILIVVCWIGLIIAHFSQDKKWFASYGSNLYSGVHKIHQISLMYITMAAIVQFIYFEPSSLERIISAIICIIFNVYFVFYELYVYYDMLKYPMAEIGNKLYDYYVIRYGYFLKSVRFEEYDINQQWTPRQWLRPYNYHILSYYKKFLMMVSLPLLYDTSYAQMVTLSLIQLIQLIRFIKTWPFYSKIRNYFRLTLQISLLLFFVINIIQINILQSIMSADTESLSKLTKIFYSLGWAGFALCFYFNISHVLICVYDLCIGLRQSNRSKMDQIRKKYYYNKIQDFQKENQTAPKQLVNKWVKLGNLNNKDYGELPEVNIRIQMYEFRKVGINYDFTVKKITSLKMKPRTKLRDPNNTTAGGKIQKKFLLSQGQNPKLHSIISEAYKRYEGPHVETIRLKTFLNIWQKDYKEGQNIPFNRSMMFQKIELFSYEGQAKVQRLQNLLPGFPIEESTIFNDA